MLELLRNGAARVLLGLGVILIGLATKIAPDYVQSFLFTVKEKTPE